MKFVSAITVHIYCSINFIFNIPERVKNKIKLLIEPKSSIVVFCIFLDFSNNSSYIPSAFKNNYIWLMILFNVNRIRLSFFFYIDYGITPYTVYDIIVYSYEYRLWQLKRYLESIILHSQAIIYYTPL